MEKCEWYNKKIEKLSNKLYFPKTDNFSKGHRGQARLLLWWMCIVSSLTTLLAALTPGTIMTTPIPRPCGGKYFDDPEAVKVLKPEGSSIWVQLRPDSELDQLMRDTVDHDCNEPDYYRKINAMFRNETRSALEKAGFGDVELSMTPGARQRSTQKSAWVARWVTLEQLPFLIDALLDAEIVRDTWHPPHF